MSTESDVEGAAIGDINGLRPTCDDQLPQVAFEVQFVLDDLGQCKFQSFVWCLALEHRASIAGCRCTQPIIDSSLSPGATGICSAYGSSRAIALTAATIAITGSPGGISGDDLRQEILSQSGSG